MSRRPCAGFTARRCGQPCLPPGLGGGGAGDGAGRRAGRGGAGIGNWRGCRCWRRRAAGLGAASGRARGCRRWRRGAGRWPAALVVGRRACRGVRAAGGAAAGGGAGVPLVLAAICALGARGARAGGAMVLGRRAAAAAALSLALMALMLALAANIGVGTMVSSFRPPSPAGSTSGWRPSSTSPPAPRPRPRRCAPLLAPRSDAVLPVWFAEATRRACRRDLRRGRSCDLPRGTGRSRRAPGAWDRLAAGEGVMINEQGAPPGCAGRSGRSAGRGRLGAGRGLFGLRQSARAGDARDRRVSAAFPEAPRLSHAVRMDPTRCRR
jgi:putative ABC transport system permease protein